MILFLHRWAGVTLLVVLASGCVEQRYQSLRLGQTCQEDLRAILGPRATRRQNWHGFTQTQMLPPAVTSIAVLTDSQGRTSAKRFQKFEGMHWLFFQTARFELRLAIRLTERQMKVAVDSVLNQPPLVICGAEAESYLPEKWSGIPEAFRPIVVVEGRANASRPSRLCAAPAGIRRLLSAELITGQAQREEIPLYLLVRVLAAAPFLLDKSKGAEPVDFAPPVISWLTSLVLVPTPREWKCLLKQAREKNLLSSPQPVTLRAGRWQIRKIAAGWYDMRFDRFDLRPPFKIRKR